MKFTDIFKKKAKPKNGSLNFGQRYSQTFLQKLGIVNSYDDDTRTYIEKGYQQNPIVYSIVNMVSKGAGKAAWCIKDRRTGEENLRSFVRETHVSTKSITNMD